MISNALVFLMDQLYVYYGKRVMVMIDEYGYTIYTGENEWML